jgi:hypothetical protein
MRGVTLKELQELLGSSLAVTMRYAHLAPEHLRTAVGRLEGLTSTEPTSPGWARTSDFLINSRGPAASRPSVFLRSSA